MGNVSQKELDDNLREALRGLIVALDARNPKWRTLRLEASPRRLLGPHSKDRVRAGGSQEGEEIPHHWTPICSFTEFTFE